MSAGEKAESHLRVMKRKMMEEAGLTHVGRGWNVGDWPSPSQVEHCTPKIYSFTEWAPLMPFTAALIGCRTIKIKTQECVVVKVRTQFHHLKANNDVKELKLRAEFPCLEANDGIIELWAPKSFKIKLKESFDSGKKLPMWVSASFRKEKRSFSFSLVEFSTKELTECDWAFDIHVDTSKDFYTMIKEKLTDMEDNDDTASMFDDARSMNSFGVKSMKDGVGLPLKRSRFYND